MVFCLDIVCLSGVLTTFILMVASTSYIIKYRFVKWCIERCLRELKGMAHNGKKRREGSGLLESFLVATLLSVYLWSHGYFEVLFQANNILNYILMGIGMGVTFSFFTTLVYAAIVRITGLRVPVVKLAGRETWRERALLMAMLLLQNLPIVVVEELEFRGFLLLGLYVCFGYAMAVAIIVQAILFSVLHKTVAEMGVEKTIQDLLITGREFDYKQLRISIYILYHTLFFIYGFILGFLFVVERNLIASIVAHVTYNVFHFPYLSEYINREVFEEVKVEFETEPQQS